MLLVTRRQLLWPNHSNGAVLSYILSNARHDSVKESARAGVLILAQSLLALRDVLERVTSLGQFTLFLRPNYFTLYFILLDKALFWAQAYLVLHT